MILNDNIRFIIFTYYTYTDSMIKQFREEWKEKIKKVNNIIILSSKNINMYENCYVCCTEDHFTWECPKYYAALHIINTLKLE